MSEMLEKVAKAMFEAGWPHEKERSDYEAKHGIDGYRKLARAALLALREPTEGMMEAGEPRLDFDDINGDDVAGPYNRMVCGRVFRAMIDSILSPDTETQETSE